MKIILKIDKTPFTERTIRLFWIWGGTIVIALIIVLYASNIRSPITFGNVNRFMNDHETLVGAFLGALAAPVGIVITDKIRERRVKEHERDARDNERRVIHYNCLVKLQWEINTIRATLEDDLGIIKTIIEANKVGVPTLQRPVQVSYNPNAFLDLYDIRLVNMLNQLFYDLRRFNFDMHNLTGVLDKFAEQKFSGQMTLDEYKAEVTAINDQIQKLHDTIAAELEQEVLDVAAYIRICSDRDASPEMRDRQKRILKNRASITDVELEQTRKAITVELEQDQSRWSDSLTHKG